MPRFIPPLLFFLILSLLIACSGDAPPATGKSITIPAQGHKNHLAFASTAELRSFFRWSSDFRPLVSAHRGGPLPGYPENSIAAMEKTIGFGPAIIEVDVTRTRDGALVLMHDETLDRTTNGSGKVADYTLAELQALRLKDMDNELTDYRIPTLKEVVDWARGKAILSLDSKGLSVSEMVRAIEELDCAAFVIPIAYTVDAARRFHEADNKLLISCPAQNTRTIQLLLDAPINPDNIIGFVGTSEPAPEVYAMLQKYRICAILGTIGNLDRRAERRGSKIYAELLNQGAAVLATDNVPLAAEAVGSRQ